MFTPEKAEPSQPQQAATPFEPEKVDDCTFSTDKLKRYQSPGRSSSYAASQCAPTKNPDRYLNDVLMLSRKSFLNKLNAFEIVSKLKNISFKGMQQLTSDQFIEFILGQYFYLNLPAHVLNSVKPYLAQVYAILAPKGKTLIIADE